MVGTNTEISEKRIGVKQVSFYLYDHLGNTRLMYMPMVLYGTTVSNLIKSMMDYFPYGFNFERRDN